MSTEAVIDTLRTGWKRSKTSFIVIVAEGEEEGSATNVAAKVKAAIPEMAA